MRDVIVAGAGMTRFGKLPGTGVRDFAVKAAADALADADIDQSRVERIFFGNAVAPTVTIRTWSRARRVPPRRSRMSP